MVNGDNLIVEIADGERLVAKQIGDLNQPTIGVYFETSEGSEILLCFAGKNTVFVGYPDIYIGFIENEWVDEATLYASKFLDTQGISKVRPHKPAIRVDFKNRRILSD